MHCLQRLLSITSLSMALGGLVVFSLVAQADAPLAWKVMAVNENEDIHLLSKSFVKTEDERYTFVGKKTYKTPVTYEGTTYDEIAFEEEVDCDKKRMRPLQMTVRHKGKVVQQFKTLGWSSINKEAWKQTVLLPACERFYPNQ